MSKDYPVKIACTIGDPTGIGPEVAAKATALFLKSNESISIDLFGSQNAFLRYGSRDLDRLVKKGQLRIINSDEGKIFKPAEPSLHSARSALMDLKRAAASTLSKECVALVTGPLDKSWISKIQKGFSGHTEFLQKTCMVSKTTMMLVGKSMRVSLVTTHIPLKKVSSQLSIEHIVTTALHTHEHLKRLLRRSKPRLALCALNPHASDSGLFGDEEKKIIMPAAKALIRKGVNILGPYPSDSLFHKAGGFDAIICMYHDQGLIPLKMKHFYDAVNVTLGLPFLRSSVDHGTAFDIAGKSQASSQSYASALNYALKWIQQTRHSHSGRART